MSGSYEELDVRDTALGRLVLRRRNLPGLGDTEVYEIKLGDALLMSSFLTESELQLAHLGIASAGDGSYEVLIGGLGLGYTALAALTYERVRKATVIELLPEVIEWHVNGRVPLGPQLMGDARCEVVCGDFFEIVADPNSELLSPPPEGYGAILVDIDHAPDKWLAPEHARFYQDAPLRRAAALLMDDGVFALWSSGRTDDAFMSILRDVFQTVDTHEIEVYNPMIDADQIDTVYVACGSAPAS